MTLDAQVGARATCTLADGIEVMEVYGKADGGTELLLAVHVLRLTPPIAHASDTAEGTGAWEEVVVPLRGGRELVVTLTTRPDGAVGHAIDLVAECRASSLAARWLSPSHSGTPSWWSGLARPIAAVSVLLATGLAIYVAREREPVDRVLDERPPISAEAGETTRGRSTTPRATTLADARLLYLDLDVPEGADAARLNELLRIELVASGRFDVTPDVDVAHAALKGALAAEPSPPGAAPAGVRLELSLVDERGEVLWSTDASGDSIETVARRAIADLVARAR